MPLSTPRSFAQDILPLFSQTDRQCMANRGVLLADFSYMGDAAGDDEFPDHANARHVLARVTGQETPRMPLGAPSWSAEKIGALRQWIDDGCPL
jgi:hypothetical protein